MVDYFSREVCDCCGIVGHTHFYCRARIMNVFYSIIQEDIERNMIDFNGICLKLIREFSTYELHIIYEAVHIERNMNYFEPRNEITLINLIYQIVSTVNSSRTETQTQIIDNNESLNLYPYNIGSDTVEPDTTEYTGDTGTTQEPETTEDTETTQEPETTEDTENIVPTNNINIVEEDSEPPPLMDLSGNIVYPLPLMDLSGNIAYEEISDIDGDEEVIYYENNNTLFVNNNQTVEDNNSLQIILNNSILVNPISLSPKSDDEFCSICYEKYENHNIIKTNCNHCFCYTCVTKFTKNKKQCPMCRAYILNLNIHVNNLLPTTV